MLKLKTIAAIIAVLLSMSISILAQTQASSQTPPHFQIEPEAMELLKKVAEAYRNIKSYQLEGVEVWESRSTGIPLREIGVRRYPMVSRSGITVPISNNTLKNQSSHCRKPEIRT